MRAGTKESLPPEVRRAPGYSYFVLHAPSTPLAAVYIALLCLVLSLLFWYGVGPVRALPSGPRVRLPGPGLRRGPRRAPPRPSAGGPDADPSGHVPDDDLPHDRRPDRPGLARARHVRHGDRELGLRRPPAHARADPLVPPHEPVRGLEPSARSHAPDLAPPAAPQLRRRARPVPPGDRVVHRGRALPRVRVPVLRPPPLRLRSPPAPRVRGVRRRPHPSVAGSRERARIRRRPPRSRRSFAGSRSRPICGSRSSRSS